MGESSGAPFGPDFSPEELEAFAKKRQSKPEDLDRFLENMSAGEREEFQRALELVSIYDDGPSDRGFVLNQAQDACDRLKRNLEKWRGTLDPDSPSIRKLLELLNLVNWSMHQLFVKAGIESAMGLADLVAPQEARPLRLTFDSDIPPEQISAFMAALRSAGKLVKAFDWKSW